jgi:hypothetical protein
MNDKRISIFLGHFGSGKSEVAVNFAMSIARSNNMTAIADLDIVNPFFKTADAINALQDKGIKTVVPMLVNTNSEVSTLTSEINTLFENKAYNVVLDLGGDDLGAKILARYMEDLRNNECEFFMVINTRRNNTSTPDKIIRMLDEIQGSGCLKITKLVNNTNILNETNIGVIREGMEIISKVSDFTKIPVAFTSIMKNLESDIETDSQNKYLIMDKYIKLPF